MTKEQEFINFGYPSDEPCVVCGRTKTRLEPRFSYSVCIEHFHIPPAKLNR